MKCGVRFVFIYSSQCDVGGGGGRVVLTCLYVVMTDCLSSTGVQNSGGAGDTGYNDDLAMDRSSCLHTILGLIRQEKQVLYIAISSVHIHMHHRRC